MRPAHRVVLAILDGWGIRAERADNAILQQGTPSLDRISQRMPFAQLETSGLAVGLPQGQMGNSEVGHTNIGAGRIVYQDLVRINRACESGEMANHPAIRAAFDATKSDGKALHLIGLLGPGGVHASQSHLECLLRAAKVRGVRPVYVHAFLDGRDTPPQSALGDLEAFERFLHETETGRVATVSGRYYAMDRDNRWDRVAARLQCDGARGRPPSALRGGCGAGVLRRENHRRIRSPHGCGLWRQAGCQHPRRGHRPLLQLPRGPGPGADPRPRLPGLQGIRPRRVTSRTFPVPHGVRPVLRTAAHLPPGPTPAHFPGGGVRGWIDDSSAPQRRRSTPTSPSSSTAAGRLSSPARSGCLFRPRAT